jgi:TonB-linked SusC/RagA family outer membrane protein
MKHLQKYCCLLALNTNHFMSKIAYILSMLCLAMQLFAQVRTITGRVTNAEGRGVSYATVTVRGTSTSVAADENGNFTIQAPPNSVLVFSASGYTSSELNVGSNTSVSAQLTAGGALTEVVVTALGQTRTKAKVGYATTTFNSEEINRSSPINPLDALAGKVPGANISRLGGPNSSTKVVLRGYGVIQGGDNQPLYVIDGIPMTNSRFGELDLDLLPTEHYDFGQTTADINPNDIESISVLKGTAATSIYGSQARNGAIIITTKRGRSGKLKVEYSGSANFSKVSKLPDLQEIFGQGWDATAGGTYIPENGSWGAKFDGRKRVWGSVVDNSQLLKPYVFIEDNIRDFYNTALELNNSIAISGGNENNNFYFSYNNVYSNGVLPTTTDLLNRNGFALRTNSKFGNFTINSSFNYINRKANAPFTGQGDAAGASMFEDLLQIPTDIKITDFRDYTNKFFNVDNYFTPYAENPYYMLYQNRATQTSDRFFGNVDMSYKFTPAFSAQLRVGGDFANARTFAYKAVNAPKPGSWNAGNNPEGAIRKPDDGSVREGNEYAGSVNGDFILRYNRSIGNDISLEALAGYNYNQQETKFILTEITKLLIPGFYNLSNSTIKPNSTDATTLRRSMATYGQVVLGYRDEVYLTLNARNDWSSTLPINNNSFFYPGANLAWIASRTFDLANTKVSLLKFRAGYGKTGSDPLPYLTASSLVLGSIPIPFGNVNFPFNGVSSFRLSTQIANEGLQPIITSEAEAGVEARFFGNRLGFDITLYDKRTKGQIFAVPIAPSTGFLTLVQNIGTTQNKGIEVATDIRPVSNRNFSWNINYTFTKNWNKILDLTGGPDYVRIPTYYNFNAEMRAYPGKPVTGIYASVPKKTGDGRIIVSAASGLPILSDEKGFYGNADYDYLMGLTNGFSYKNWNLNFSLDYRKGGVMYSGTAELLLFTGSAYTTTYNDRRPFIIPNSVVETGTDAQGKPVYEENTTPVLEADYDDYWNHGTNDQVTYQYSFIDRSFLKLRDISLAYRLPASWASKIRATGLTITAYGGNVLLWTPSSNVYIDPEASNLGNDLTSQFGEYRTAPTQYHFGFSLKANF